MTHGDGRSRNVVVFGAGSDIGAGIAGALVADIPGRVVLAARNPDGLGDTRQALHLAGATEVHTTRFDAGSVDDIETDVHVALDLLPSVEVVVVAFGTFVPTSAVEADPSLVTHIGTVNYLAAMRCGEALKGRLRAQGSGTVVVVSSLAATQHRLDNYVYASSKAAMDRYFTDLGTDLQRTGARTLIVRPGGVRTKSVNAGPRALGPEEVGAAVARAVARRRHGTLVVDRHRWRKAVGRYVRKIVPDWLRTAVRSLR